MMSSTSFNPIQIQQTTTHTAQPLSLKQGQVFQGTVKQLYPDQMAEIQVGSQRLMAKLEVPLKAGDGHYFQVTSMNPQTELKVVTGPVQQGLTATQQMQQLLETMNLPKSIEIQQVLAHFLKEQLPISKEQLLSAEQWMKLLPQSVDKSDIMQALQRMAELKMPFTKEVFTALIQGQKTSGITAALDDFTQLLTKETNMSQKMRDALLQQIQHITKPLEAEKGGIVLARAIQLLTSQTAQTPDKLQALAFLKQVGIMPQQATIQNALQSMFETISKLSSQQTNSQTTPLQPLQTMQQAGQVIQTILATSPENTKPLAEQVKQWVNSQALLSNDQKQQLQQLVQRLSQLPQNKQTLEVFAKQLHEQLIQSFASQIDEMAWEQDTNGMTSKEHVLSLINPEKLQQQTTMFRTLSTTAHESSQMMQQIALQADEQLQTAFDSKAMAQTMKIILKELGISYEAILHKTQEDPQTIAQQLKPQLLNIVQDSQISAPVKESAEMLLARMNGMQLLSGENGHQHQLIMQVPLDFFGRKMDATLQWNGRMKDDGKIDASYARVLFYLQMESMQETVIDMQVQNRIVTVTVYNNHDKQLVALAEPLKVALKAGLADKDYQLSGVVIKSFAKPIEPSSKQVKTAQPDYQGGVDIRV